VSSLGKKEDEYRRITYDLALQAARALSKINPDMTFCYVSGSGTDSSEKGRIMWARVKGKTENDLAKLPFKNVFLFRPGLIKPIKGLTHAFTVSGLEIVISALCVHIGRCGPCNDPCRRRWIFQKHNRMHGHRHTGRIRRS
jgi:hypothetical protein